MFLLISTPTARPAQARRNRPLEEVESEQRKKQAPISLKLGKVKIQPRKWLVFAGVALGFALLLGIAYTVFSNMPVRDIGVKIEANDDNHFHTAESVKAILDGETGPGVTGRPMKTVSLKAVEEALLAERSVLKAEAYKSVGGTVQVELVMRKPVARLINNSGASIYLDEKAVKFEPTELHTANVPLIRGDFEEGAVDTFACNTISAAIPVLNYVRNHEFWNAQISEVAIDQAGELTLYTQIGDMPIYFGQPERIAEKFSNLMDFYKQVLPELGWKYYRSVSIEYKGQVVARKR
ncbi:MAG: hypothetical protein EAZ89_18885 [Bacteroidetes bacterium]|nr:MAG: hypothetical protein EAZ89_18885 [Bacteroidota bacterium]